MLAFRNLTELARADEYVHSRLNSPDAHTIVAEEINIHCVGYTDFQTTESSVRRFRAAHVNAENMPWGNPEELVNDQAELEEDIGDGMGLDDAENDVDARWKGFTPDDKGNLHKRLDAVLDAANANPEDVAGLRVSQYEMVTKNAEGNADVHQLYSVKLLVRTKDLDPAWPVVQPATPTVINPVPSSGRKSGRDKTAVILPDPQIGFRFYMDDQTFDPFHDDKAMDVALQIIADVEPELVICLGDYLDLPACSTHEQEQAFQATTQHGIDRGHVFAAQLRNHCGNAEIKVMEGNHDRRLMKMITRNAMAAFGLRRANEPKSWPVLSVPYLCRFDDLEIEYVEGYPAGQIWLNDNLRTVHGTKVRSNGSTAAAVVYDDAVSTIFGHIHRVETQYITRSNYLGPKTLVAHSPGCLCRIDGAVPSVKGSTGLDGRPVESWENWQQGLTVVSFEPGDGSFALDSVFIDTNNGYKTRFQGRTYSPSI